MSSLRQKSILTDWNLLFHNIIGHKKKIFFAFLAIFSMNLLYCFTSLGLHFIGKISYIPLFINIPEESYFLWQSVFSLPVTLVTWFLASSILKLIANYYNGAGSFEDTCTIVGFSLALGVFPMWVVDTALVICYYAGVLTPAGWDHIITVNVFWKIFNVLYAMSTPVLISFFGVIFSRKLHQFSLKKAIIAALPAMLIAWMFWGVFVR